MIKNFFITLIIFLAGLGAQKYFSVWEKGIAVFEQGLVVITDKAATSMKSIKQKKNAQKAIEQNEAEPTTNEAKSTFEEKPTPTSTKEQKNKPAEKPIGRDTYGAEVYQDDNGYYGINKDGTTYDVMENEIKEFYDQ